MLSIFTLLHSQSLELFYLTEIKLDPLNNNITRPSPEPLVTIILSVS